METMEGGLWQAVILDDETGEPVCWSLLITYGELQLWLSGITDERLAMERQSVCFGRVDQ